MAKEKLKKWKKEEKAEFLRLCKQRVSWAELYAYFPNKTAEQIRKRHAEQLAIGALRARETPVERRISLPTAESEAGSEKENEEPSSAGQRPMRRGKLWSEVEDRLLCNLKARDLGWQEIWRHFPERTPAGIMGRWHLIQPTRSDDVTAASATAQTPVRSGSTPNVASATPQRTHLQGPPAFNSFPVAAAQPSNSPALTIREQIEALDRERKQHEEQAKHLEQCERDLKELQQKLEEHQKRAKELKDREQAFRANTARLMGQRQRMALQEEAIERRDRKAEMRHGHRGRGSAGADRGGGWRGNARQY